MDKIKDLYKKIKDLDKKKKACLFGTIFVVGVMLWAFITAGIITSKFNRNNIENSADEQKVDAIGIIITETKEGKKYFEIYGETGNYSNENSYLPCILVGK